MTDQSCCDLPRTQHLNFYEPDAEVSRLEFRLTYQGPLRAEQRGIETGATGRATDKHRLRKHFHLQMRELWKQHPDLRNQSEQRYYKYTTAENLVSSPGPGVKCVSRALEGDTTAKTWLEHIAEDHARCGGNFVPLIRESGGFTCSLDILFLRRDNPGSLIANGGDIDNRIKVLFDGLRMPKTVAELGGLPIDPDENPFFCLLEDDQLITSITVTTDRLITPRGSEENINDVYLVIHVTVLNPSQLRIRPSAGSL